MTKALSPEAFDSQHLWHPYSGIPGDHPAWQVVGAQGTRLKLADGRQLIDGMSSWWAAIHGYNHPVLNAAANSQIDDFSHVMFGGLTHEAAIHLGQRLLEILPARCEKIFYCDSGSVAVEVAIKMATQYWQVKKSRDKRKLLTVHGGYHGDTFAAMSLCDPESGMHRFFSHLLPQNIFVSAPSEDQAVIELEAVMDRRCREIAAVIIEPIVQGAGGMRIYEAAYLRRLRELCDRYDCLLICDEIATGFGRTGKMFACEHAEIAPDIICTGKALSGGYLSLAATVCTAEIASTISDNPPHVLCHGPTYMANPLACRVACASMDLLKTGAWQQQVANIEAQLREELAPCRDAEQVADVRCKGAIGVVETHEAVDVPALCAHFVDKGVWIRPFGKLVYVMPPYIISNEELGQICAAIRSCFE